MTVLTQTTLAAAGLILSMYAQYVEYKMENSDIINSDVEFVALCDIAAIGASCSKVFASPAGHLLSYLRLVPKGSALDFSNASLGIISYLVHLLLVPTLLKKAFLLNAIATTGAFCTSVYLAYQLTYVLKDLCILCWTTHFINAGLFYYHVIAIYVLNPTAKRSSDITGKEAPKIKRV